MELKSVTSTNIAQIGYDLNTKVLRVIFKSGTVYDFTNVGEDIYSNLLNASSVGKYFHQFIRDKYFFNRVK